MGGEGATHKQREAIMLIQEIIYYIEPASVEVKVVRFGRADSEYFEGRRDGVLLYGRPSSKALMSVSPNYSLENYDKVEKL